jgi:hypothetical protein
VIAQVSSGLHGRSMIATERKICGRAGMYGARGAQSLTTGAATP